MDVKPGIALAAVSAVAVGAMAVSMYQMHHQAQLNAAWHEELQRALAAASAAQANGAAPAPLLPAGPSASAILSALKAETAEQQGPPVVRRASETPRPAGPVDAEDLRARMSTAFEGDRPDPSFSQREERAVRQQLTALLPEGSTLKSFDCRTQMCRIEASHESTDKYNEFVRAAFMNPTTQIWNGPGVCVPPADDDPKDGSVTMITFLARPGQKLPSVVE